MELELELESERQQGAHEVGGARPHPRGEVVGPLAFIFCRYFLYFPKQLLREVLDYSENVCFCT